MSRFNTPLDVYKILPKTNCGECSLPTCMAFAASVLRAEKKLSECPYIESDVSEALADKFIGHKNMEQNRDEVAEQLRSQVASIDLLASAERLGATVVGDKLSIKCLGRDFFVDKYGTITSECHTHSWVTCILLDYVLNSKGGSPSGQWVPFRELKKSACMGPLFEQLCEKPLKEMADSYTDLFKDLIYIFSGDRTTNMFSSDMSLILYPLPKVPMLICYWERDGELDSSLHVFFDSTVEDHLNPSSINAVGTGLAMMFEKTIWKHRNS